MKNTLPALTLLAASACTEPQPEQIEGSGISTEETSQISPEILAQLPPCGKLSLEKLDLEVQWEQTWQNQAVLQHVGTNRNHAEISIPQIKATPDGTHIVAMVVDNPLDRTVFHGNNVNHLGDPLCGHWLDPCSGDIAVNGTILRENVNTACFQVDPDEQEIDPNCNSPFADTYNYPLNQESISFSHIIPLCRPIETAQTTQEIPAHPSTCPRTIFGTNEPSAEDLEEYWEARWPSQDVTHRESTSWGADVAFTPNIVINNDGNYIAAIISGSEWPCTLTPCKADIYVNGQPIVRSPNLTELWMLNGIDGQDISTFMKTRDGSKYDSANYEDVDVHFGTHIPPLCTPLDTPTTPD